MQNSIFKFRQSFCQGCHQPGKAGKVRELQICLKNQG